VPQGSVKFPVSNFCPPWGRTDFYWEILAVAPSRRGDVQENHAACRGTHCCGRTAFRVRANFCGLEIGRGDRLLGGAWLRLVRCPVNTQFSNVGRGAGARRQDRTVYVSPLSRSAGAERGFVAIFSKIASQQCREPLDECGAGGARLADRRCGPDF